MVDLRKKAPSLGLLDILGVWFVMNHPRIIGGMEVLDILGDVWDLL